MCIRDRYYIFRDSERCSRVSVAFTESLGESGWRIMDLTDYSVDAWEPTFDINRWNKRGELDIFVQEVHQGDGEKVVSDSGESTTVKVIELRD